MTKQLLVFFVCLLGGICSTGISAQNIEVRGKVTDDRMEPIPGANVMIKGTTVGTFTDIDGNYAIMTGPEAVLEISSIGFMDRSVNVSGRTVLDVVLESDMESIEETVVIAYGTKSKATITGAMSSVGTEELLKSPAVSVTNMLAGSLPGVSAVQTSGQPGKDAATIYIRGSGSLNNSLAAPLVMVDGVERDFSQIDPNEIESISVLKDASSTAVFGVRGANGVILVTTRRGLSGKPKVSVCIGSKSLYNLCSVATANRLHIRGISVVSSKTNKQKIVPNSYLTMVAILPAEDIGKTHIAVATLRTLDKPLENISIGERYLSKGYRGRCSSCALRVHSTVGCMP